VSFINASRNRDTKYLFETQYNIYIVPFLLFGGIVASCFAYSKKAVSAYIGTPPCLGPAISTCWVTNN
jgi:hypothetical protein